MNYDQAFLQDVLDAPDDDTPRLIYADWLEDNGEPARAEFIRLQIRLCREGGFGAAEAAEMEARIEQLRLAHDDEWAGPVVSHLATGWGFQRGFVEAVTGETETFCACADELFAASPIHRLKLIAARPFLPDLFANPLLLRLSALDLTANGIGDEGMILLARSRFLRPLTALCLRFNAITLEGLQSLTTSPHLKRLRWLDLSNNSFGFPGVVLLRGWPLLDQIVRVELDSSLGGPLALKRR